MTNRWECQVCGYIHQGAEPPAACPVCGADRSQFVLLKNQPPASVPDNAGGSGGLFSPALHLHPILSHFPNGVMPTAWLFLGLYFLTGRVSFEEGAFWLVAVVFATTPLVLASGVYSWKKRYAGRSAPIFYQKITLAVALLLLGGVALLVRASFAGAWSRPIYLACLAVMLVCVALLGYLGGKLVFSHAGPPKV